MRVNLWTLSLMSILALAATANAQPGGGGRGGRGGGMFGRGGMLSIVKNEAVQKELGLSADDATKVKAVTDEFDAAATAAMGDRPNFREMSQEERTKAFAKMAETAKANNDKFLPKLKDVLTADQFTRLQQIHLQVAGIDALTEAEVIKSLAISTEQQESIKTINSSMDTKRNELFASLGGGGGGGGGGDMREKMNELTKERETKVNEVLTKDQQDKFATLKGKEFDVSQLRPQGRGPGGGGGRGKRPQPKAE